MKVALLQMDIALGDVAANRAKAQALLKEGLSGGARLFVLPELWTTGYQLQDIAALAESQNGDSLLMLQEFARENRVEIIAGSMAELEGNRVFNTAYAISVEGKIVAKYRKIHLIGLMSEDQYIAAGATKCLFNASFGPAGIIICYDLRFTELPRSLALQGSRALFVPAEWPTARGGHWLALNVARAIENQIFVMAVNRVGRDDNNEFFGHSLLVDPFGNVLAQGSEKHEEVIIAEVDFDAVEEARRRIPVYADRRPECY